MDNSIFFVGCALALIPIAVGASTVIVVIRDEDPLYVFIGFMLALYVAAGMTGIRALIVKTTPRVITEPSMPLPPQLDDVCVIVADVEEPPSVIGTSEDRHTVVIVENPRTALPA